MALKDELWPVLAGDVLAPALVSSWLLFRGAVWRRGWMGQCGAVLAVAAAWLVGNWQRELFPWHPEKQWEWLPRIAAGVMLVGFVGRLPQVPRLDRWTLYAVASVVAAWMLTPTDVQATTPWAVWLFGGTFFVEWVVLDALAEAAPGGAVAMGVALLLFASGSVVFCAGWGSVSEAAIRMGCGFAGLVLVAWWFRVDIGAAVPAGIVFVMGLLFAGYNNLESNVPLTSFLLPALAPLAGVLLLPLLFLSESRRRSFLLQALFLVLILVPVIVAVVLAVRAEPPSFDE